MKKILCTALIALSLAQPALAQTLTTGGVKAPKPALQSLTAVPAADTPAPLVNGWRIVGKPFEFGQCGGVPVNQVPPADDIGDLNTCVKICGQGKGSCHETQTVLNSHPGLIINPLIQNDPGYASTILWEPADGAPNYPGQNGGEGGEEGRKK